MAGDRDDADGTDDEWRFSLSDLEDTDEVDDGGSGEGVAGTLEPSDTIEPGEIDPENALFVLVGVVLASVFAGSYAMLVI